MRKLCLPLRRILLSFFFVASAACGTIATARAEDPACQVTGLRGSAVLEHAGTRSALVTGTVLSAGDMITTAAGARVKLHFADGSEVRLGENAQLRINAVEIDSASGTRNILLSLPMGLLRAAAAKLSTGVGSIFEIHTGVGYSAVRGTHWIVAARGAETRVYVQEGRVAVGPDFQSNQFPKLVEAGRWVSVTRKSGIGSVQDTPPGSVEGLIDQTEASLAPGIPDDEDVTKTVTFTALGDPAGLPDAGTDTVSNAAGAVGNVASGAVGQAASTVSSVIGGVGSVAGGVVGSVGNVTGGVVGQTTSAVSGVVGSVGNVTGGVVGQTTSAVSGVVGSVGNVTGGVVGQTTSTVSGVVGSVGNVTGGVVGQTTSAVSATASTVGSTVGSTVSAVGKATGALTGALGLSGATNNSSGSSGSASSGNSSSGGASSGSSSSGGSSSGGASSGGSSSGGSSSGGSSSGGSSSGGSSSGGSSSGGSSSGGASSGGSSGSASGGSSAGGGSASSGSAGSSGSSSTGGSSRSALGAAGRAVGHALGGLLH